ncbi:MAG: hypothetical protein ACLTG4_09825 [Oscillospiraceae bacterium]
MSRNAKILIDLAVLAAVYGVWLLPKWRPLGRRTFAVYTLMYGCLAGIALFTLMPVLAALPFCFDHPYVPMHMAPFEDVILRHGDYVRQIVLNIALFVPFGVLLPLCRAAAASGAASGCLLLTLALNVGIEVISRACFRIRTVRTSSRTRPAACWAMRSGRRAHAEKTKDYLPRSKVLPTSL